MIVRRILGKATTEESEIEIEVPTNDIQPGSFRRSFLWRISSTSCLVHRPCLVSLLLQWDSHRSLIQVRSSTDTNNQSQPSNVFTCMLASYIDSFRQPFSCRMVICSRTLTRDRPTDRPTAPRPYNPRSPRAFSASSPTPDPLNANWLAVFLSRLSFP